MKGTENFTEVIKEYLRNRAREDKLFLATLKKENKNIEDCIKYILNTVSKQKVNGFADDEIFSMAVHYYDEDDIDVGGDIKCRVLVNQHIELTEEEIEEEKQKARQAIFQKQKAEMTAKRTKKSQNETKETKVISLEQSTVSNESLTLF